MRASFILILLVPLSFALLSVDEINIKLKEARTSHVDNLNFERLNFTNAILPVLSECIRNGDKSKWFGVIGGGCGGVEYGNIRPASFCNWWNERFGETTGCRDAWSLGSGDCHIGIEFNKK